MARSTRVRIGATEHRASTDVMSALTGAGMTTDEAVAVLTRNSARLRRTLRLPAGEGPIVVNGESTKVEGVAGVIRLAPSVELDIAPKFLDLEYPAWREDLLALSNYTRRGDFLSHHVRAGIGHVGDLASVIGRAFVTEFWQHYRKPLRLYRLHEWRDFELNGELDASRAHEQRADGFPQSAIVLDRRNPYNAVIAAAAGALIEDVRDPTVRRQLLHARSFLGDQAPPRPDLLRPVPARHRPWADLVQLSRAIISGGDLTLEAGRFSAPGYVLRTWEAWEQLVCRALRSQLGFETARHHLPHKWGERDGRDLHVFPDLTILGAKFPRLVDAKYKTRLQSGRPRIARSDLMESAAFMSACRAERIVLLYPRSGASPQVACGEAKMFDSVTITPGRRILGFEIEVRGFSAPKAHREFASRLAAAVDAAFSLP